MHRRDFMVATAAAVLLRKLPLKQPRPVEYDLGWSITQELLEDDLYPGRQVRLPRGHYKAIWPSGGRLGK